MKEQIFGLRQAWASVAPGIALFLGVFSLINLAGSIFSNHFDASIWWIDMRALPAWLAPGLLAVCAGCLLFFAVRRPVCLGARMGVLACCGFLATLSLFNALVFFGLSFKHQILTVVPLPFSILIAASLAWIAAQCWTAPASGRRNVRQLAMAGVIGLLCAIVFPLAQMFFFGKTDYRRPADVAVVPGARAYADGRASDALADRVRTACDLYRSGLVKTLVFSGGPGDGAVHETEAMRSLAVRLGVHPEDILLDREGLNTHATVRNTGPMLENMRGDRILVVSHFYHLPRLKLAYARLGREVYTVPAHESYFLRQMPFNIAREVVALWAYYLRPG